MMTKPILYVEDEENDQLLLRLAFQKAGVFTQLNCVGDGQSAIDYLAGNDRFADRDEYPIPGLVLLDLNLPRKSGIEILRWVRQQPEFQTVIVIVFSSSNREIDIRRAYAAGANAYVVKPSSLEKLVAVVRSIRDFWLNQNCPPSDWAEQFTEVAGLLFTS